MKKNEHLEKIFRHYAFLQNEQTVGDVLKKTILPPTKPEKILDLHGYFEAEATMKTEQFLRTCRRENLIFVRIITGKGTGILQRAVRKILSAKNHDVTENEHGFFDVYFQNKTA